MLYFGKNIKSPRLGLKILYAMLKKMCLHVLYFSDLICDLCPANVSVQLMFNCSGASYT